MATIKLKRGTSAPTTSNIVDGEIAVDKSSQKLYIRDGSTIKEIGRRDSVPLSGGTMTGNLTAPNLSITSTNWFGFGDYGERITGSNAAGTLTFLTDATTALQLDSSQNATFSGTVTSETTTGDATFVAYRNQTTLPNSGAGANLIGAYLFKSSDTSGSEPHYAGIGGFADQYGRMELQFFTERDNWDSDPRVPTLTLDISKNATFAGSVTANAGVVVDNITIDGTEIDLSSGDLTLDVAGSIFLDADNDGVVSLKDGGTTYGTFYEASNHFNIQSNISDGDIIFRGSDGGSGIIALTLDMSAAGDASFNSHVQLPDSKYLKLGADGDFIFYHDGTSNYIQAVKQDSDIIFRGNDGGTNANFLTLDTSAAGYASFTSGAQFGGGVGIGNSEVSGVGLTIRENSTTNSADFRNANASGYGLYSAGGSGVGQYALRAANKDLTNLFSVFSDGDTKVHLGGFKVEGSRTSPGSTPYSTAVNAVVMDYASDGARFWSHGSSTARGTFDFIQLENDGQNQQTALSIGSDGYVGIASGGAPSLGSTDIALQVGSSSYSTPTIQIRSGTGGTGKLWFGDNSGTDAGRYDGYIQYYHGDGTSGTREMRFGTEGTLVLTLDSSQNATFSGDVSIPVGDRLYLGGGSHTYISEDVDDRLRFFTGGAEFLRFTEGANDITHIFTDLDVAGTVTSTGNMTAGTILTVNAPDGGGSPAMTATLNLHGYEGRGAGIKIKDSVNSASSASDREWFIGSGYSQSGFSIGYASDGSQSSYAAQNKLSIDTDGDLTINAAGDYPVDVVTSQNAARGLRVHNANTGTSARAMLQAVAESASLSLYATSANNATNDWGDAAVLTTDSGTSGGLVFNTQASGSSIRFQYAANNYMNVDSGGVDVTAPFTVAHSSDEGFTVTATDTTANAEFVAMKLDYNASGSTTTTADRHHIGLEIDVDSSATGGGTDHEHRLYGIWTHTKATGDSDKVYGAYIRSEAEQTAGTVTDVIGVYGRADSDPAAGTVSNAFALYGYAEVENASGTGKTDAYAVYGKTNLAASNVADIGDLHGVYAEIELDDPGSGDAEIDTIYAFRAEIDNNDTGTVHLDIDNTESYLFYGNYSGTQPGNAWGVYIPDTDVPNYFGGKVGVGTSIPESDLHLKHAASPTLRIQDTTNDATLLAYAQDSEAIIGTYSAHNLGLFTDSGRTMTLNTSHNVGIGTTSIDARLHVEENGEPGGAGTLLLEANSSSRQLRLSPPSNSANGYINYLGGNLLFLDDGSEVARFQSNTSFELNTQLKLKTTDDNANYYSLYTYSGDPSADTFRINYNNAGSDELILYSVGNVTILGSLTENSDERLKENIEIIPDAIKKVSALRGVTYTRKDSGERKTGLIAQDVASVLPEAVDDSEDFLSLRYGNTVGLLVEAIKEQQTQIETLTKRIEELENK